MKKGFTLKKKRSFEKGALPRGKILSKRGLLRKKKSFEQWAYGKKCVRWREVKFKKIKIKIKRRGRGEADPENMKNGLTIKCPRKA